MTTTRALARLIPDCLVLAKRLLADPRVPRRHKLMLGGLVAYLAMPLDLIPDFIPVVGLLDDALLVALVLRTVARGVDPELLEEHWPGPVRFAPWRSRPPSHASPSSTSPGERTSS
jgi:uncharacterized membrane protein YkvA (DUF1232 family)